MLKVCLIALLLYSCSFQSRPPLSDVQKDLDERNQIVQSYASIEGTYVGELNIKSQSRIVGAKLAITYREVAVGSDNDGQIRYRPRLFARLSRPEMFLYDIKLEGVYEPLTGDLTLSSPPGDKESYFFRTRINNGQITGDLRINAQILGSLNVKFQSSDLSDDVNDQEEVNRLIAHELKKISGAYRARVTPDEFFDQLISFPAFNPETFNLILVESRDQMPQLFLYYRKSREFLVVQARVEYRPDLQPAQIRFETPRGGPGQETFTFNGFLNRGKIEGEIVYPTFRGRLVAEQIPKAKRQ